MYFWFVGRARLLSTWIRLFFFILIIATICHSSAYGNSFQLIYLSVIDEVMLIQCCAMLYEQHNYIAIRSADLAENVSWV